MSPHIAARDLLAWYDGNARKLPWRALPGEARMDPYCVWLSEIMLQQTTVAAVKPYFAKFTEAWPTVEALAAAEEADILAAWAGLGYYARARNLVACAGVVATEYCGRFPETEAELRTLPGIGDYTAAAIAAIAFGEPATVVDANVERVVSRLEAIDTPLPKARRAVREIAAELTPSRRAGDFAQAMMDLGATVCTSRNPDCNACPLVAHCAAAATGEPEGWPVKPPKKAKPQRRGTAYWLEHRGEVLLIRRPAKGMLGGMRALPSDDWDKVSGGTAEAPANADWQALGAVDHVFTHFALTLDLVAADAATRPDIEGEWWPVDEIETAGLPTLFAKAATLARALRESAPKEISE